MRYCNEQLFRSQFGFLKRQFLQDGGLPFTEILSREAIEDALDTIDVAWNERIYTPLVTLWVFLGQVLSADASCRNAVARLIVHRVSQGFDACSAKTGTQGLSHLAASDIYSRTTCVVSDTSDISIRHSSQLILYSPAP